MIKRILTGCWRLRRRPTIPFLRYVDRNGVSRPSWWRENDAWWREHEDPTKPAGV